MSVSKHKLFYLVASLFSTVVFTVACSNPLQNNTSITDKNSPIIVGPVNDSTPVRSKTWNWGCSLSDPTLCEYRYAVDTNPTHVFADSDAYATAPLTFTQSTGTGTYYLHLQVRNMNDHSLTSVVYNYSAVLDNTVPTITSVTTGAAGSYTTGTFIQFNVNVSENVTVTGSPRLDLTVGSSPRYADYISGSGSGVLIFRYSPQAGDTDSDGIAFASTSMDFNGGTIQDQVLWDLTPAFTPPVISGIFVDTTAPVVTGLTNDATPTSSKTWTWGCSEICTYRYVVNTTAVTTPSGSFSATTTATQSSGNGTFYIHVQARDAAGNLSAVVHVSALINGAVAPAPNLWTWTMSSPTNGSFSNDGTPQFVISGASADNGAIVQLYDDASCTNAVGGTTTIAAGVGSLTGVSYTVGGTQDGQKNFYAIAHNGTNFSVCTDIGRGYFFDSVNPNAPTSPSNLTAWVTTTATSALFSWATPVDPGGANASGITNIQVGLSTSTSGGNDVAGWNTLAAGAITYTFTGLTLTQCTTYYPSIRGVDKAGLTSTIAVAPNFRADSTAPTAPSFSIANDQTLTKAPTLTITTAGTDNCSFQGYDIAISKDVNGNGVLDAGEIGNVSTWASIGVVTTYQKTLLSLAAGSGYFVSLRSKDAAGNTSPTTTSAVWYSQYCEGLTNGVAYYGYDTPATAQLSDMFAKATAPGWSIYDYASFGTQTNITAATTAAARPQADTYSLAWMARLEIKTAATYTFYSASDDGSDVYIGNTRVVANDGLHGVAETSGTIALTPGCYDLQVRFFENNGGDEVTLNWSSPSITKAAVPTTVMYPKYTPMPQINWRLDTGSGTVATDSSMNGFNGTMSGTPVWNTTAMCPFTSAKSLHFDGVDDHILSPTFTGADILQTNLSAAFWVKFTSSTAGMVLMDLSNGGTTGLVIRTGPTAGTLGFDTTGGTGTASYTPAAYNDGGWHHVLAIRRGTNLKMYVDGVNKLNYTITSGTTTFTTVDVGRRADGTNYFTGDIDQIKVWNEALDNGATSNAAQELFNNPCR